RSKSRSPKVLEALQFAYWFAPALEMVMNRSGSGVTPAFQKTWNTERCQDAESAGFAMSAPALGPVFHPRPKTLPTFDPLARARKLIVYHCPADLLTPD